MIDLSPERSEDLSWHDRRKASAPMIDVRSLSVRHKHGG